MATASIYERQRNVTMRHDTLETILVAYKIILSIQKSMLEDFTSQKCVDEIYFT